MSSIFISYRRDDAEGQAGRLYDDLVAEFGADSVFMDVADIQPGRDFRKVIEQSLSSCGAFLSVIGKGWVTAKDESGKRRLDDPADFVRVETATALRRDIPLVPVLVQGATTPKPDQLPDELKDLAYRNAMEITHARWDSDVQLLIKALRSYSPVTPKPVNGQSASADGGRRKWSAKQVGLVTAVLVAVIGMVLYLGQPRKAEVGTNLADSNANAPPEAASDEKLAAPNSKEKPGAANARMSKLPFDPGAVLARQLSLSAEAKPLPQKDANGNARYSFTLSVKAPEQALASISRVHYDLVLESNPLSLEGGPAPGFSTSYEGWGCYRKVVVTAYLSATASQPQVQKTFDMCNVLQW